MLAGTPLRYISLTAVGAYFSIYFSCGDLGAPAIVTVASRVAIKRVIKYRIFSIHKITNIGIFKNKFASKEKLFYYIQFKPVSVMSKGGIREDGTDLIKEEAHIRETGRIVADNQAARPSFLSTFSRLKSR